MGMPEFSVGCSSNKPVVHVLSSQYARPHIASAYLVQSNLQSPERHLIALRMEHADLDALIDQTAHVLPLDELALKRLKKRRLALRDQISRLEMSLSPNETA